MDANLLRAARVPQSTQKGASLDPYFVFHLHFPTQSSPSLLLTYQGIRRAAVNCFGYIAKAIGPQDVLATLLNNLRVADRTMRVCTTVAIAIVAETCEPYTVIPALMNEVRA